MGVESGGKGPPFPAAPRICSYRWLISSSFTCKPTRPSLATYIQNLVAVDDEMAGSSREEIWTAILDRAQ
jgi:hypothetical protein